MLTFVARKKGQRHPPNLLPNLIFEHSPGVAHEIDFSVPPGGTPTTPALKIEVLGQFDGFSAWGMPCVYDRIAVTLQNGTVVPCYRHPSTDNSYAICQSYQFLPIYPK